MIACLMGLIWNLLIVAIICGFIALACWLIGLVTGVAIPDLTVNRWARVILILVGLLILVQFIACLLGAAPPSMFGTPFKLHL